MKKINDINTFEFSNPSNSVTYDQYWESNINQLLIGINKVKDKYIGSILKSLLNDVISLKTAKGQALDAWGILLNFSRSIQFNDPDQFIELNDENFDELEIVDGDPAIKRGVLKDDAYRLVLQIRYQTQNTLANIPNVSPLLTDIVGARVSVNDELNMKYVTYYLRDELPAWLHVALSDLDILPRPAGCGSKIQSSICRYFYFYPGVNIKELSTFYFAMFYDNMEDPYYQSKTIFINPRDIYKPFQSWYNLNLYQQHINTIKKSLDDRCKYNLSEYKKYEYRLELLEAYEEEWGEVVKPGEWEKRRAVFIKELLEKPGHSREDMPESWLIKGVELEYLNAKRDLINIHRATNKLYEITQNINLEHMYFYEDEIDKYLFYNSADGFYYMSPDYNINSITNWCKQDGYVWVAPGISDFYTPSKSWILDENKSTGMPWQMGGDDKVKLLKEYVSNKDLMLLRVRRSADGIVYGELPSNPFYTHWHPKLVELVDNNNVPADKREEVIEYLYKISLITRDAFQDLIQHLWDLKQCNLEVASIKNCATIYNRITAAPRVENIDFTTNQPQERPDQLPTYYDHMAIVYRHTADEFGAVNHISNVSELCELRAKILREQAVLFKYVRDLHFKECRNILQKSFTHITSDNFNLLARIKVELKKLLDNQDTAWVDTFVDNNTKKCLDLQKECIENIALFKSQADKFLTESRYNAWVSEAREGHGFKKDMEFLLDDLQKAKASSAAAENLYQLGMFAEAYPLDLRGIQRQMGAISDHNIRLINWDPNRGAWKRWRAELVHHSDPNVRKRAGNELKKWVKDNERIHFDKLVNFRKCEIRNAVLKGKYLSEHRRHYALCDSRILNSDAFDYKKALNYQYLDVHYWSTEVCSTVGDFMLPSNKFTSNILRG